MRRKIDGRMAFHLLVYCSTVCCAALFIKTTSGIFCWEYYYLEQGGNFAHKAMRSAADRANFFKEYLQQFL